MKSVFSRQHLLALACFTAFSVHADEMATTEAQIQTWIHTLAADEAAGRMAGSASSERIGNWLAEELRKLGAQPLPGQSDFFQRFVFKGRNGSPVYGRNVLAILPGTQPAAEAEYILLSAHYDHIGVNPALGKDSIHNGADDNASGVTAVLGIAAQLQALRAQGQVPNRAVMIAFWDAEEMGIRGARHFVKEPLLPLEKIVTNLNFEMVGVTQDGGQKNNLWMTGWNYSTLFDTVKPHIEAGNWSLEADPFGAKMNLFRQSDNIAFAEVRNVGEKDKPVWQGIPAHSFSVWRGQKYYHQPSDEVRNIDTANLHALTKMMAPVVMKLSAPDLRIHWKAEAPVPYQALVACSSEAAKTC